MKNIFILSWLVVLGFMINGSMIYGNDIPPGDFYVSLSGDDNNDGSIGSPFATIGRAQQAVRDLITGGLTDDVLVYIRGGNYYMANTLTFTSADSGTADYGVTYAAYPGEEVRVIGGAPVDPGWFTTVTDPSILDRLPEEAQGVVMSADLGAHGITNYGTLDERGFPYDYKTGAMEVIFNGEVQQVSRWPNPDDGNGFAEIAAIAANYPNPKIKYSGDRPDRWTTATDMWIYGSFSIYWRDIHSKVLALDTTAKTIEFREHDGDYIQIHDGGSLSYFWPVWYAWNLLEEIDQPGEWYMDRTAQTLYIYPPAGFATGELMVSTLGIVLDCQNTSYLTFEGIVFEAAQDHVVNINGGSHNCLSQCVIRNSCAYGAYIQNGEYNGLNSCLVYSHGDGGVNLKGGDRENLVQCHNYVNNCHINRVNRWCRTYKPAIMTDKSCGEILTHNLVHDAAATALMVFRSNAMVVDYNEIYDACKSIDDNGVIYSGQYWESRGVDIKYNFIHDITSIFPPPGHMTYDGVHAVYLESAGSGHNIVQNIFYNIKNRAVMICGGRNNLIDNNIMDNCGTGVWVDKRLKDSTVYTKAVAKLPDGYQSPPWSVLYPELVNILSDEPELPKYNEVYRNVSYQNGNWTANGYWGWFGYDFPSNPPTGYLIKADNLLNLDPCFVDEANLDMHLQPTSPVYTIPGWQDIPFDQIGLEPTAPVVYVTVDGCGGSNYVISGQCDPWATIQSATILQNAQDIASYLTVADNGAISGTIPRSSVSTGAVTVEIVTVDPKGHESPVGTSNTWADADVDDDCSVDISDYADLLGDWLSPCSGPGWCDGADINQDGIVNLDDVSLLFLFWNDTPY